MAKVFTGKVLISGDNIKDYLQVMEKAEKRKGALSGNVG
jgi:hypothetical protein